MLIKKTTPHPQPPPISPPPPSIARPIAGELQQWLASAPPGTGEAPEQTLRAKISMCVVKSDKNGPENSPVKPPARATRPPRPPRPPREPETAGAARAAAGATFPGPETSVGAIRRRGRPAGEGEGAAAGAEAAGPAGELGSAAAAAAMAAATEAASARGPVNS
jgi:hypothetical protein